jgi:hypothetical protein
MSSPAKLKKVESLGHPVYDSERLWTSPGIWHPPENFDAAAYQRKLNEICGLSGDGQPVIRVQWAWAARKWTNYEWDEFGNATKGEWRQKYRCLTVELPNDEYVDISPPRWVLEERFEPGQYERSWESSRYVHDAAFCRRCRNMGIGLYETSTTCTRRDVWGPAPRDGWYNLLPHIGMVAEHERGLRCCARLWKSNKEICYGRYKVPDGLELRILREARRNRDRDAEANPHEEMSVAALEQARQWGMDAMREEKVSRRKELEEIWRNEREVHGAKIVTPREMEFLKAHRLNTPIHREFFPLSGKQYGG